MRNILLTLTLLFVMSMTFGQESMSNKTKFSNVSDSSAVFKNNPQLIYYGARNSYSGAWLLQEQLELTERLEVYRKKQVKRQWIGAGMMATGLAGLWYVGEMDPPVYQDGNDAVNEAADEQTRKRKMIAWPSALIGGAGAFIFVDSFKFSKWTKLEVGMANIKLTQEIYGLPGKRNYFNGKESELKNKSLWKNSNPRYRQ